MAKLPKPLFEWKPEMINEGIHVLQAYNYRISIERAKEIHEITGKQFAEKILALFTEDYLKVRKDVPVVASTCIETFALMDEIDANSDAKAVLDALKQYTITFGYPEMLTENETKFREISDEMKKAVSGKRAKYELMYLTHITKCLCMNFMSDGHL
jgi:hypothetical protein